MVGVDLGLTTFATLSDGEKVESPRPLAVKLKILRRRSRQHARKVKGSANGIKPAITPPRLHRRIRNTRNDFVHKLTTRLAKTKSVVVVEDLAVKNMMGNHKLARHIGDQGWGEFRRQLAYKCGWYGSHLAVAPRFFASSKTCSACGHVVPSLSLSTRTFVCPACGHVQDRDVNASKNLVNWFNSQIPEVLRESTPAEMEALAAPRGDETTVVDAGMGSMAIEALKSGTVHGHDL